MRMVWIIKLTLKIIWSCQQQRATQLLCCLVPKPHNFNQ